MAIYDDLLKGDTGRGAGHVGSREIIPGIGNPEDAPLGTCFQVQVGFQLGVHGGGQ